MKQKVRFFLCFCVAGVLTSCNAPFRPTPDSNRQTVLPPYQTVSAFLTETAQVSPTMGPVAEILPAARTVVADVPQSSSLQQPQATPTASATPAVLSPPLTVGESTPTPRTKPQNAERSVIPCDIAQPGRILDVSVPDDTKFSPGVYFSKTWRLVNAGTCPWTRDYAVVWFSGDDLGVVHVQHLETNVIPGQAVDVTVDMISPQAPGAYQSNWKLRNAQGALFGIGPASASPFWVRIAVVQEETPTVVVVVPTMTPVPVVLASGDASLTLDTMLDLDTGQAAGTLKEDLALQAPSEGQMVLATINGAKLVSVGAVPPDLPACLAALIADAPPASDSLLPGTYYCYRTSEGLPGQFALTAVDTENGQLNLHFITWVAP